MKRIIFCCLVEKTTRPLREAIANREMFTQGVNVQIVCLDFSTSILYKNILIIVEMSGLKLDEDIFLRDATDYLEKFELVTGRNGSGVFGEKTEAIIVFEKTASSRVKKAVEELKGRFKHVLLLSLN